MKLLQWLLLTACMGVGAASVAPGDDTAERVATVSFDGSEFVEAFNTGDAPKLVLIFSPTCGRCLRGAGDVGDILKKHPEAKLKVLVLWSPVLGGDTKSAAVQVSSYLDDKRVVQFWDLWKFGMTRYKTDLGYPADQEAWDVFIAYGADARWGASPPQPVFWMQDHNLQVGAQYSKEALETELLRLAH